ncbi:MAG: type 1 glutamine amidotransferase [Actinomycetales bacterium]
MTTAVVLSHRDIAHELGPLGEWLEEGGFGVTRTYREDDPAVPAADLLVVLGSPQSVATGYCAPPGDAEIARVRAWLDSGRPYLGICFGAQVLARALGGSVTRLPSADRGWMTLAVDDPQDTALVGPWMVWHEDAFVCPDRVHVRARSATAQQAISLERAWGVQFHPELTSDSLERMAIALGAGPQEYGPVVEALDADAAGHRRRALDLFDAFWAEVNSADQNG